MKSCKKLFIPLLMIFLLLGIFAIAEEKAKEKAADKKGNTESKELTADEIVKKANHVSYYQGMDGKSHVEMLITDNQGRTRERSFTILRKNMDDKNEAQKYYVHFNKPADVRNMVFLVWKHVDKDDDRWLYLPALDLVKRIAASDKRTSFVGSNFLYEDVSGRYITEDAHTIASRDDKYFIIKNEPKKPDEVEFSYYNVWIDKENFMPMKAEYYDKDGKKYRSMETLKVEKIEGYPTVTKSRISDLVSGGNTIMTFSKIDYDIGVPEQVFTERYLRRAPRKWLK